MQGRANLLESRPNEINEDQWRVALGPGGSLPRDYTPVVPCLAVPCGRIEKSHPSRLVVTNQGREISELVRTRRLVKFPGR